MKKNKYTTMSVMGIGIMGAALVRAFISSKKIFPGRIKVFDIDRGKMDHIASTCGVKQITGYPEIETTDIVLLAVKPQQMEALISSIKGFLGSTQIVISIAAGVTTSWLEQKAGKQLRIVRAMPNTPIQVGEGMTALASGAHAAAGDEDMVRDLFSASGKVIAISEQYMNAVTALSGSGPAYVYYLAEAMMQAGISLGLEQNMSADITRQTLSGATRLLNVSPDEFHVLRNNVTSPKGTTEAAIGWMESHDVKKNIIEAIGKAKERGDELTY